MVTWGWLWLDLFLCANLANGSHVFVQTLVYLVSHYWYYCIFCITSCHLSSYGYKRQCSVLFCGAPLFRHRPLLVLQFSLLLLHLSALHNSCQWELSAATLLLYIHLRILQVWIRGFLTVHGYLSHHDITTGDERCNRSHAKVCLNQRNPTYWKYGHVSGIAEWCPKLARWETGRPVTFSTATLPHKSLNAKQITDAVASHCWEKTKPYEYKMVAKQLYQPSAFLSQYNYSIIQRETKDFSKSLSTSQCPWSRESNSNFHAKWTRHLRRMKSWLSKVTKLTWILLGTSTVALEFMSL